MTSTQPGSQPSRRHRSVAAAVPVALLLIAGSLVPAVAQEPSDAQAASPSGAAATPLPEGFTPRMARQVSGVLDAVPGIRELPAADGVAYRVIDQDTFRTELEALFREEYGDAFVAAEDAAFTRLGLLGPDDDLGQLILDLYDSQVLAYYDPRTTTFSLVGPTDGIGDLESVVVAHEYAHALQDAAFDLEANQVDDLDRSDAILAQQALIEGDATAVMMDWAARELSLLDLLRVSGQALTKQDERSMRRLPDILRRQLEFPYVEGLAFVNAMRGRGDWGAVDEAWAARPVSTEQVLHPDLYPDEVPVDVALPDLAERLGAGWTSAYEQTLGEMQTGVWVADGRKALSLIPGLPAQLPKAGAAAGWGGDRLVSLDGPEGAWAVVWQTDWDTEADAAEFRDAARQAVRDLPGAHAVSADDLSGGLSFPVLVLVADGEETLAAAQTALGL